MKKLISAFLLFFVCILNAQDQPVSKDRFTKHNKGKVFFFWGGNRANYSSSNIKFMGDGYHFTLWNAAAEDKPMGWHIDYINPTTLTIPQTNYRAGYYFSDHYNISAGVDHMKYVMRQFQTVSMSGAIKGHYPFDGSYYDENKYLSEEFLTFEHTDGLNYINTEIARVDDVSGLFCISNTDKIQINLTEGLGAGLLFPKTNTMLMGQQRYDEFHLSGYGISAKVGLNVTFFKYFFVQTELKCGYINMDDIRTTANPSDRASQNFTFVERIIAFGGIFKI